MHFSSVKLLKISLATVFIWFGALKLFGVSPVVDVVAEAYPFVTNNPALFYALAVFEIVIGIGILVPRFSRLSAWFIAAHLAVATLGVLISPMAFDGSFPYLSVVGEFVVKNFVLVAGALVVARD